MVVGGRTGKGKVSRQKRTNGSRVNTGIGLLRKQRAQKPPGPWHLRVRDGDASLTGTGVEGMFFRGELLVLVRLLPASSST